MLQPNSDGRFKLSSEAAKTLPTGEYPDATVRGLRLYVTDKGARTWGIFKWSRELGKPVRKRIGDATLMGVVEARREAQALAALIDKGEVVTRAKPVQVDPADDKVTFEKLTEQYTAKLKLRKAAASDWLAYVFKLHYGDWLKLGPGDLTREMIVTRQAELALKKRGNATESKGQAATRGAKALKAVYKFAIKEDLYVGLDYSKYADVAESEPRDRVLSVAEEKRILEVLDDPASGLQPWTRPFFRLLLACGVRWGNLCSGRFDEMDLDEAIWSIPSKKAKGRKALRIRLSPAAVELLRGQRQAHPESEWVFPSPQKNKDGHLTEPTFQWARVLEIAKLSKHATPHDLRRTFGSRLISSGVPLTIVSEMLGHKDVETTRRHYAHVDDDAVREALAKLAA